MLIITSKHNSTKCYKVYSHAAPARHLSTHDDGPLHVAIGDVPSDKHFSASEIPVHRDPLNLISTSSSYRDVSTIKPLAWQREQCRSPPHAVSRFKQMSLGSYRASLRSACALLVLLLLVRSSNVPRSNGKVSAVVTKNGNASMARERSKHGNGNAWARLYEAQGLE